MKRGFTLIELLAVIVLIALISLLTVTTVSKQYKDGKVESTCQVVFDEAFNNMDESRIKSGAIL